MMAIKAPFVDVYARMEHVPSNAPTLSNRGAAPGRIVEVDAVRGIAAATVVLYHSLLILPNMSADTRGLGLTMLNIGKYSPLHALFSGSEAVLVFFVISGFVLSLPYFGPRKPTYRGFLVRRVARIWPAYAVACGIAFLAASLIGGGKIAALSSWFNGEWQQPLTGVVAAKHLALIDKFHTGTFDPVLWSLVHEMRISIIFPLLFFVVVWGRPLAMLAGVVVWTFVAVRLGGPDNSALVISLRYIGCFALGVLVSKYRYTLVNWLQSMPSRVRILFALTVLLLYTYPWWMPNIYIAHRAFLDFGAVMFASAGWLLLALASQRTGALLRSVPLQFLGRISYSLYLVHAIVVLALVHLLYGKLSLSLIIAGVWVLSLGLATLGERYVERPSMILGRRIAKRFAN
jgi:peptidoglycan/LPS O-acetylase OafA/YrhL